MKKIFVTAALFFAGKASAQLQMDKISHLAVGGCIGGFSYSLTHKLTQNRWAPATVGMTLAFGTAVAKEIRDRRVYGSPMNESLKDVAFTTLGAGLACLTLRFTF
jgi:hypothetical protein